MLLCFLVVTCTNDKPSKPATKKRHIVEDGVPANALKLIRSYPDNIIGFKNNRLYFADSTFLVYDDSNENKSLNKLVNDPDVEDQFFYDYPKGTIPVRIKRNFDPGRIRNEKMFKKIYGETESAVRKNLVEIIWCPKLVNERIKVTKINNVYKAFEKVSKELDTHPELKKYLNNIGGIFNWRNISGTNRLSAHSFGMTIDINTGYSDYWQWNCHCTNEEVELTYKNRIPQIIVDIFERNGFIWGGKWYHYDTMHFEYRPELLL
jgi:hypothetical protein